MNILIIKKTFLFLLISSMILFPIAPNYIRYSLLISFIIIFLFVINYLTNKKNIKIPFIFNIIIFLLIFILTFQYSILLQNNIDYVVTDSFGFILYLIFPIIYIFLHKTNLFDFFKNSLLYLGFFLAIIHVLVFILFNLLMGDLTYNSITFTNNFIKSYGLSWELAASEGTLRVNTKSGHYFLLVFTILCIEYLKSRKKIIIIGMVLIFLAMILDGHRTLLISWIIIVLSFIFVLFLNLQKYINILLLFFIIFFVSITITFSFFIEKDVIIEKLQFKGESTELRVEQFASLVDEIGSAPILGNGFGSYSKVIRNTERPYMYELDFLAVVMKLGIPLSFIYFLTYLHAVFYPFYKYKSKQLFLLSSCGISYFIYMSSNGGFAMSPITSMFHMVFFIIVIFYIQERIRYS